MNSILGKLKSYDILTNLLPGAFFCLSIKIFFQIDLPTSNEVETLIAYYFIGLIVGRISSLVTEPFLKKINFLKFAPHEKYLAAARLDPNIDILSETNNYYRSLVTCVWLLPFVKFAQILSMRCYAFAANWHWIMIVALFFLLLFGYKKQTSYVRNRVNAVNSQDDMN